MSSTISAPTASSTSYQFDNDPYLQYQPAFAYTLPIQLLVNGITVTLLVVLLIHLLFTAQYHYPLAPLNYCLQLSSIVVVLISVVTKTIVVLQNSSDSADQWPYSLVYVAVSIPPDSWSTVQNVWWFLLQALVAGLSNITHIQFLTLLFPSRTEARLIIFILGPLAIASSGLVFVALTDSQTALDIGDAIRNTLNSTLLLIFTIALFIWGLFVNRRRAWRNDGGTAMFGLGSLSLAVISTTFNFVAVAEDGIEWLGHLLIAAVLWQIWLGWWWWVGSGMGIGEVEDIMERAERKKRKAAKRHSRARAAAAANGQQPRRMRSASLMGEGTANAVNMIANSVTGILRNRSIRSNTGGTIRRRTPSQSIGVGSPVGDVEEGIELGSLNGNNASVNHGGSTRSRRTESPLQNQRVEFLQSSTIGGGTENGDNATSRNQVSTNSETSSTSHTPSLHSPQTVGQFISFPGTWLLIYLRRLRHAHEDAAKKQVLQRAELRQKVFAKDGRDDDPKRKGILNKDKVSGEEASTTRKVNLPLGGDDEVGWGLGRFGIKEHEASARRLREAGEQMKGNRLLSDKEREQVEEENNSNLNEAGPSRPIRKHTPLQGTAEDTDGEERESAVQITEEPAQMTEDDPETSANGPNEGKGKGKAIEVDDAEVGESPDTNDRHDRNDRNGQDGRRASGKSEDDWEDVDTSSDEKDDDDDDHGAGRGWSWWGPLKNWRRADRSTF